MNNFAPVLIPTLNRYEHFKRCVVSLAKCTHADKTELYIALDYPANESHWNGYKKIKSFLPKIRGFKKHIIIKRDANFGPRKNISEARDQIFGRYDRIIFSEDDNKFSPNFLDYINKGLEKFEDDKNVLAVCGYNFPIEIPRKLQGNYFYYRSLSAWGYGTWKNKWKRFCYSPRILSEYTKKWQNALNIYKRNPGSLLTILSFIENKKHIYGDMAIGFYMSKNSKYHSVFPVISKVRNHGHDGSGGHCGILTDNNYFESQEVESEAEFEFSDFNSEFNKYMNKKVFYYFNISIKQKAKTIFKYIIYLINTDFRGTNFQ